MQLNSPKSSRTGGRGKLSSECFLDSGGYELGERSDPASAQDARERRPQGEAGEAGGAEGAGGAGGERSKIRSY